MHRCCCCFRCFFFSLWLVVRCGWIRKGKTALGAKKKRYHLRWLVFNTVWKEVTMSCVQHVTYFLNAFNFMVKSFDVIFSLFLIGFVRNPPNHWQQCTMSFSHCKVVTVVFGSILVEVRRIEWEQKEKLRAACVFVTNEFVCASVCVCDMPIWRSLFGKQPARKKKRKNKRPQLKTGNSRWIVSAHFSHNAHQMA